MKGERPPGAGSFGWPDTPAVEEHYVLCLYVTGTTPRSTQAIENIRQICEQYLRNRYNLEVIDIYQNPQACRDAQIIAAPTLIKILPEPLRRVIGDLSDHKKVLASLNLVPQPKRTDEG